MTDAYVPLTGPPTWQHAACRGEDPELWFDRPNTPNPQGHTGAQLCFRCEHRRECLAWADHIDARDGIWGGLTADQRQRAKRRRQRRPRRLRPDPDATANRQDLDDALTGWMP